MRNKIFRMKIHKNSYDVIKLLKMRERTQEAHFLNLMKISN